MERFGPASRRRLQQKRSKSDDSFERGAQVLTKAILNLSEFFALERKDLRDILGISEPTLARIHAHDRPIQPDSKEGELAILLVRVYRSLYAILGGDEDACRKWLRSKNVYFEKTPLESMKSIQGMIEVVQYLDAMRGQY